VSERDKFLAQYSQAAQLAESRSQKLTTSEFMLAGSPGKHRVTFTKRVVDEETGEIYYNEVVYNSKYKNRSSAGRAFRKLRSDETSGERIFARGDLYAYSNKQGDSGWTMASARGGAEAGLWKVIVHYEGEDTSGNAFSDQQKSFIVHSNRYDNYYDAKSVEYETGDEIDAHMEAWTGDSSYGIASAQVTYIEVIRVQYTTVTTSNIVSIQ